MVTRRLFVGIPLSSELAKRLERLRESWKEYPLILIPKENLHVTLLFLGFLPEERLEEVCEGIERAVENIPTFEMHFTKIELFPSAEAASIIALAGEASDELRLLRQGLEKELGYLLPERKSFSPHVNVARVRRSAWEALDTKPPLTKSVNLVEPVGGITLFESLNEDGKRRYQVLNEFFLT